MTLETFFEKFTLFADAPDAVAKMRELIVELAVTGQLFGTNGWTATELGTVCERIHYGYTAKANHALSAVRLLRITDIQNNKVSWQEVPGCEITDKELPKFRLGVGDILIARTGGTVGKSFLVQDEPPTAVFASYLIRLIPLGSVLPAYLKRYLESPHYWRQLFAGARGAAQPNVNGQTLAQISFSLPPLPEQKRIVAKVDELMAVCDRLEEQLKERDTRHAALSRAALARFAEAPTPANLEYLFHASFPIPPADLRKTILTLAVQGKLVPQDPNDESAEELIARLTRELTPEQRRSQPAPLPPLPAESLQYEVPASWTWARFRDVAIIASNLVKPDEFLDFTHLAPDNIEKGNGVLLPCRTVREDKVISSNHRFFPGQIVYSKIRPNLAKVVVVDFEGLCSADMYPIDALIDAFYLQRYMLSESFLVQAVRTDTRVAMPKINQMELNAIAVPVPPLTEQRRIVEKVDELMALVDALETQLATARSTAEALLTAAVAELTNAKEPHVAAEV